MNVVRPGRVSVIGAGRCDAVVFETARTLGNLLARYGLMIVCGGLGGVMTAVCQGAREAGGRTIGILPGDDAADANPFVEIPVVTGLGIARNVLVVKNGDVVVAVSGGAGTLSEIGLALKIGRPVVVLGHFGGIEGVIAAETPQQAAAVVQSLLAIKPRAESY
ncbi:TIGR00725 family protein [Solidesulfovibrio sp.]